LINWHRLFGLSLKDFFTRSPFDVEVEIDLSVKRQFLDIVILRRRSGQMNELLPDGLDNIATYNLITYKSTHEALDSWTIDELLGHTVNYVKLVSPRESLLPIDEFRLYGISTRFPKKLAGEVELKQVRAGVYEAVWGAHRIRILVLREMPKAPQNALWEMFSGEPQKVASGLRAYEPRTPDIRGVMNALHERYGVEGAEMPYTWEDFRRDYTKEHLHELTLEERLEGLSSDERLEGLEPSERLEGLSPEERLQGLSPEELARRLKPSERLEGLSLEDIESYLLRKKREQRGAGGD
jgi:hypothetical protein